MNSIAKYFYTIIIVFKSIAIFSATQSDTIKNHKFSIGYGMSLFSIMKYDLPHYSNLNPEPKVPCKGSKCSPYEKPTYQTPIISDYQHVQLKYAIHKSIKLSLAISHIHEGFGGNNINYKTIRPDVIQITSIGRIRNRYIGICPSLSASIKNNSKERFYTNIEAGLNIDFIYHESRYRAYEVIDSVYSPYRPSDIVEISDVHFEEEPRANKLSFNRISPYIHLYFEWYNKNKTISYSLGSAIIFKSIYQLENTAEFYTCYKITPITMGISYYF